MLFVRAWVVWVTCLRGWRVSVGGVLVMVVRWRGWHAEMGGVGAVLVWVAC